MRASYGLILFGCLLGMVAAFLQGNRIEGILWIITYLLVEISEEI